MFLNLNSNIYRQGDIFHKLIKKKKKLRRILSTSLQTLII